MEVGVGEEGKRSESQRGLMFVMREEVGRKGMRFGTHEKRSTFRRVIWARKT